MKHKSTLGTVSFSFLSPRSYARAADQPGTSRHLILFDHIRRVTTAETCSIMPFLSFRARSSTSIPPESPALHFPSVDHVMNLLLHPLSYLFYYLLYMACLILVGVLTASSADCSSSPSKGGSGKETDGTIEETSLSANTEMMTTATFNRVDDAVAHTTQVCSWTLLNSKC